MSRRTKIVATLGPATDVPLVLDAVLRAGADVVRVNLSHGTLADHRRRIAAVREASDRLGRVVAVLADLPGPKVRAGEFPDGGVFLIEGAAVRLVPGEDPSSGERITVDYPTLLEDVDAGDRIVLGDGAISLTVASVADDAVYAVVITGGRVQGRPGVHLPSGRLRLTTPTDEDLDLATAMAEAEVDYIAASRTNDTAM